MERDRTSSSQISLSTSWEKLELDESIVLQSINPEEDDLNAEEFKTLLNDAQIDVQSSGSSSSIVQCPLSPERSQKSTPPFSGSASPHYKSDFQNQLTVLKMNSNPDWVWDWSSCPDNRPPPKHKFKRPKSQNLSIRKTKVMRHTILSKEFLQVFIPSIIVSNILAFGIGLYIGKKLAFTAKN